MQQFRTQQLKKFSARFARPLFLPYFYICGAAVICNRFVQLIPMKIGLIKIVAKHSLHFKAIMHQI